MKKNIAKVYMRDGQVVDMTHAQASRLQYIMDGLDNTATEKQIEYASKVKRVVFGSIEQKRDAGKPIERERSAVDNAELRRIHNDKSLVGIEKARAVAYYLKNR